MEQERLDVDVHQEAGAYWAEVRELPGCFASGDDVPELIESVHEAVALYLAPERCQRRLRFEVSLDKR